MKSINRTAAIVASAGLSALIGAQAASADTVTAGFSYTNLLVANVMSPDTTGNVAVNTVSFHWTRTDAPGPGVDSTILHAFSTFCIEIAQHVSPSTPYTYEVFDPKDIGWSATKILGMQTLWADHFNQINSNDTSCAFQLAVWELAYDTDRNLDTGPFRATSPGTAKSIAQGWLSGLGSSATPAANLPNLHVLVNEGAQDQITANPDIPAPGPAACAMLGLAMLGGNRRRRAA